MFLGVFGMGSRLPFSAASDGLHRLRGPEARLMILSPLVVRLVAAREVFLEWGSLLIGALGLVTGFAIVPRLVVVLAFVVLWVVVALVVGVVLAPVVLFVVGVVVGVVALVAAVVGVVGVVGLVGVGVVARVIVTSVLNINVKVVDVRSDASVARVGAPTKTLLPVGEVVLCPLVVFYALPILAKAM